VALLVARRRLGFTLVQLVVSLAVTAFLAGIAGTYYQGVLEHERRVRARAGLHRISIAWSHYQIRHGNQEPARLEDLTEFIPADQLIDPWGNPYLLSLADRTVRSLGPNGKLPGGSGTDSEVLEAVLPPTAPNLSTKDPGAVAGDHYQPVITDVSPLGIVTDRRPYFTAQFDDNGTGIDPDSTRLFFDGEEILEGWARDAESISWQPPSELTTGSHEVLLHIRDFAGNVFQRPWRVTVH